MDILVNVSNQKLKLATNAQNYVSGTQEFVRFKFNLTGDWDGLLTFAQFIQSGVAYNQYLDEENSCYLPSEIGAGTCTLMLYGTGGNVIATTNYLTLRIDENIFVGDAESTEITESLYQQLVTKVNSLTTWNEQASADLTAVDNDLQAQINTKAAAVDLTAEIARARAAEASLNNAVLTKADQSSVDTLELKVTQLENNEVVAELIEQAVTNELLEYLESGELANMTIQDGSITRDKVNAAFEATLAKADTAMQKAVYDTENRQVDVYDYAEGKAESVRSDLNTLKTEVQRAYKLSDTVIYQNLGDAVRGAVTMSRNYANALLADYEPFEIVFVDELPIVGDVRTFYLVPKANGGEGYDKYWYIIDDNEMGYWDVFGGSSTVIVTELPTVGDPEADYILKSSTGCLYYKYIDGVWRVIAGSIASVVTELPEDGNAFTDYYLLNESGSYIHYRYINGHFKMIGGDGYTQDEIDTMMAEIDESLASINTSISNLSSQQTTLSNQVLATNQSIDSLAASIDDLEFESDDYDITFSEETRKLTLLMNDEEKTVVTIAGGGGGGESGGGTTLVVERITESPLVITPSDKAEISFSYSSTDSDGETVDGTYTWKLGSRTLSSGSLVQGTNTFDLTEFCTVGTQKLTLTVEDEAGSKNVKVWTVQIVDMRIASTFNDRMTYPVGQNVSFSYTPYGNISKTVHFVLDGEEIDTLTTSSSGTLQSFSIDAQDHGAHLFECYITATINNVSVETNHIYKDIIWYDEDEEDPIIGCIYRFDYYGQVTARQYDTTAITYNVFDPNTSFPVVKRYLDNVLISTDTVQTSQNVWNFKSDDVGLHVLRIETGNTSVTIKVNVIELGIDVSPITGNLEIDFNPTGMTNNSENRIWSNDDYSMTVSDNFDWANGGYRTDENGDTYFLIKAGTSIEFDYEMFGGGLNANPSVLGAEMKIIFMTENVQDANAVWLSNVETTTTTVDDETQTTNVGIQMGVHEGWLKTNVASDTDIEGVAATNTYLYMPYSEEDIIEMDINIDTLDTETEGAKAFVMSYEDGVPSKAYVYDSGDRFYQYTPQPITIGSDYCDVRIYRLKLYSTALSTENIMKNFIADSRDSSTMLERYDRNSIYYNRETNKYTPYSGEGVLDPEKLAQVIPNVKVLMLETDHFTTSKKTFVKSNLRCIHASGGNVYSGDSYYDNWYFENGYHAGQGTTSDNYGNSGRNVDFLFNCDGTHKPSDKVDPEANYISKVTLGYGTENAVTNTVTDWKGDDGKVDLTRTSVPNNFYNLKVNIASSENSNNALLQKRYNDFLPYISPAKARDSKIKNDMEFVPAVLFLKETNPDISTHNEFLDTEWHKQA